MPIPSQLATAITIGTILTVCGLTTSTLAAPQSTLQNSQASVARTNAKANIIKSTLNLQPGDEQLMNAALQSPLTFIQKTNSQEFTRELIVHAHKGKANIAQNRIAPAIVKSSQFIDEYVITVPNGLSEGELAAMLMATGDYLFVEPNWKLFPIGTTPNDPLFDSSWQHNRIQSAAAWDLHTGNSDIIVAICDTGVDVNHPDLQAAYVPGYNAVNNQAQVDGGQISDVNGHGSFVSGCAAAQGNNGTGVVGVGWDFSIMPIRVSNNSDGTASGFDLLEGARWASDNGAQAINVSYSGGTGSGVQTTANYIIDRGGLLFWAAGNDNNFIGFDAPDLVIVASTTSSDNKSWFSNYGPAVDISAPGSSVRSTNRFGGYTTGSGTSYASPIAAGVGAMIFSVRSDLSGRDVQDILYQSVDDLGAPGRDNSFGRGRVNTFNAIQVAQNYTPRLQLPIIESFNTSTWTDLFTTTEGAVTTIVDPESNGGGSVLLLDATDQITSVQIAGSSLPLIPTLSYQFKVAGVEAGETFTIEMLNDDDTWQTVIDYTATGVDTDGYVSVALSLPIEFRWHGTQLRIAANGSDTSDQWLIDDLLVGELEVTPVAPFVDSFESGIISNFSWAQNNGTTVEVAGTTHAASMAAGDSLQTQDIPLAQFGFVPSFVRFDAWSNGSAGADDTILVEAKDVIGNWITLGTITGDTLTTSPATMEFQTPLTTWATDIFRVRLTSAGNDPILIDNVYVGPDELTQMCSAADFAEPFGTLNFFDVSAFLTAFGNQDPAADMDGDGNFNFLDVSDFLSTFGQGCP